MKPSQKSDTEWNELLNEALTTPKPRELVVKRAINLFQAKQSIEQVLIDTLDKAVYHITAILKFDSFDSIVPAYGVRSGDSTTRQLLFVAEGIEIDLRISSVSGSTTSGSMTNIVGQVLGMSGTGNVRLEKEDSEHFATLSELNEFSLPNVPGGNYQLTLTLADREIVVNELIISKVKE
jgi:hypothetical protein